MRENSCDFGIFPDTLYSFLGVAIYARRLSTTCSHGQKNQKLDFFEGHKFACNKDLAVSVYAVELTATLFTR